MPLPPVKDAYSGRVNEITLGGGEGVRRIVFADVRKAHMLKGVAS